MSVAAWVSGSFPKSQPAASRPPHAPIFIQGNAAFTAANGVVGGSGTPSDPYLIAGWEITNVDAMEAIFIRDTDASFVIRDVYVHQPPGLGFTGIRFIEVSNGRIENSTVVGFSWGVSVEFAGNITVTRSNVTHNGLGVQLWYANQTVPGVVVSGNNLSDNQQGVSVSYGGSTLIERNLLSNDGYGIQITNAANVSAVDNHLSNNLFQALLVTRSSNLTIESNGFAKNGAGLWLSDSLNATLVANTFDQDGIVVLGSSVPTLTSHSIGPDNLANGKPIWYFKGQPGLIVDGTDLGQLIVVDSTDVSVRNVSANHADVGVELARVRRASIQNSNFSYDDRGVFVDNSSEITLTRDSVWFSNESYLAGTPAKGSGVDVRMSRNVTISLSNLSRNEQAAVFLDGPSENVTVSESALINNTVAVLASSLSGLTLAGDLFDRNSEGVVVTDSKNLTVRDSDITRSVWFSADFGAIANLTVSSNRIADNTGSFCVRSTRGIAVSSNAFSSNEGPGLCLVGVFSANITDNRFTNNAAEGIQVYDSEAVKTFGNAFADNYVYYGSQAYDSSPNPNTWDDGYPTGGNFWSNYGGVDRCSGPKQDNCTGPDGIGDAPYPIQTLGTDRYPLIRSPWNDTTPPTIAITFPSDSAMVNVSSITVRGSAADSGGSGLRDVKVRVSSGDWFAVAGLTSWTTGVTLVPGVNRIDAQAWDNAGNPSAIASVNVTFTPPTPPPPQNTPPYANFSFAPASGDASTVFTFNSTSWDYQDPPSALQVRWDWETNGVWDTPFSTNKTATHQFSSPGNYTVTMEVVDAGGLTANRSALIRVTAVPPPPPPPLQVNISVSPVSGTMPLTVSFTGVVTGGVAPYQFEWHFGDGAVSPAAITVHIYVTGGNFTVWLNVNDGAGTFAQSPVLFVNVTPAAVNLTVTPPAQFVASSGGITVTFAATVTGGTPPYTYRWDFGDGMQSDQANPTHTYAVTGSYTVSVTVTDARGQSATRTFAVVVPPHSTPIGISVTPFVLIAAVGAAAIFAGLWWNERRRGRKNSPPP